MAIARLKCVAVTVPVYLNFRHFWCNNLTQKTLNCSWPDRQLPKPAVDRVPG